MFRTTPGLKGLGIFCARQSHSVSKRKAPTYNLALAQRSKCAENIQFCPFGQVVKGGWTDFPKAGPLRIGQHYLFSHSYLKFPLFMVSSHNYTPGNQNITLFVWTKYDTSQCSSHQMEKPSGKFLQVETRLLGLKNRMAVVVV